MVFIKVNFFIYIYILNFGIKLQVPNSMCSHFYILYKKGSKKVFRLDLNMVKIVKPGVFNRGSAMSRGSMMVLQGLILFDLS